MISYILNSFLTMEPNDIPICHCVAADFALGAGFAKQVTANHKAQLRLNKGELYRWYKTEDNDLAIYHLVTKQRSYLKPSILDFSTTLRNFSAEVRLPRVRCPMIGSGLDGLDWDTVHCMLFGLPGHFEVHVPAENIDNAMSTVKRFAQKWPWQPQILFLNKEN